jgi:hypothetical protein
MTEVVSLLDGAWGVREVAVAPSAPLKSLGFDKIPAALRFNNNTGLWIRPTKEPTDINNWTLSGWWFQVLPWNMSDAYRGDDGIDTTGDLRMYSTGPAGVFLGNEGTKADVTGPGFAFWQQYWYSPTYGYDEDPWPGTYYATSDWSGTSGQDSGKYGTWDRGKDLLITEFGRWKHLVLSVKNNIVTFYLDGEEVIPRPQAPIESIDRTWNKNGESNALGLLINSGDWMSPMIPDESYACQFHNIDGLALGPEEFRTDTGKPKRYTGEFGNNGFYIPVQEGDLETDFSGKENHGVQGRATGVFDLNPVDDL